MNRTRTAALLLALTAAPLGASDVELLSRIPPRLAPETGGGASLNADLSADGRFVVFESEAENLVAGVTDRNQGVDVFLYDRVEGETVLVSRSAGPEPAAGDQESRDPEISADGRFVTFWSAATDLVAGQVDDGENRVDIFLWDRVTGTTELVSHAAGSRTVSANGGSGQPVISGDGRFVAFTSLATDLVRGVTDGSGTSDVFLYDRRSGAVSLVSRSSASPRETALATSFEPAISADGRRVAFLSFATDLVPGQVDGNQSTDVFLWDRTTGRTDLVSHRAGNPRATGSHDSFTTPFVSADGASVAFGSRSSNLVPGQSGSGQNVYLWERASGRTTLVSHTASSRTEGAGGLSTIGGISADGSSVLYHSTALNLVPGQQERPRATADVFLWSRSTGTSRLVSGREGSASVPGNRPSMAEDLSADGAWAVFSSSATNLIRGLEHTHPGFTDVYLWSRSTGRTTLLSHTAGSPDTTATGPSSSSRISADGRWIAYLSAAPDLEAGTRDTNNVPDVILESRAGDREIVTLHARGLASATPTGSSAAQSIDASGRFVVFLSAARELFPDLETRGGGFGVFLYDRTARARTLLSGDRPCQDARISADGRVVAFACGGAVFLWSRETTATTLLADREGSSASDLALSADGSVVAFVSVSPELVTIFAWDQATGTVSPVAGNREALGLSLDASGRVVAFHSPATDLVTGVADARGTVDVFVLDRTTGTTTLVSRAADGAKAVGGIAPRVSGNGRFVLFTSESTRLVPGQTDSPGTSDLFLYDRETGTTRLVSHEIQGAAFAAGGVRPQDTDLDASGRFVAFASTATNLIFQQADSNGVDDVFLFDRESGAVSLISRDPGTASFTANGASTGPRLSADGRFLVFLSNATTLAFDPGGRATENVYVYDQSTGITSLVSHSVLPPFGRSSRPSSSPLLAASGSAVAFTSDTPDLVPRDFNDFQDAFVAPLP
jgi:Tol biopolymer transport system component